MIISNHNINCRQVVTQKVVYREGINSPTNVDLVTTILITTHIRFASMPTQPRNTDMLPSGI